MRMESGDEKMGVAFNIAKERGQASTFDISLLRDKYEWG